MIARVTLEIALRREFDYIIPPNLAPTVEVGSRVKVPFGHRQVIGVVTAVREDSPHTNLRPIARVIGRQSPLTPQVLELARWMADYYCCAPETAVKALLPDSVRQEADGWRERLFVRITPVTGPMPELTRRQQELWNIIEEWRELPLQRLLELSGATAETVRRLEDKGLVTIAPQISERDPYANEVILPTQSLVLNPEQDAAFKAIVAALDQRVAAASRAEPATFLLHGVTGSGKTEVYLQAIAHTLQQGQGAIVLVPEISLTPQTVERFKARFSSGPLRTLVAVLHSHLSAGERHDEWHKIRQGRARIVIGARSAVFAPVEPLGLIIVDEEHEHSYKQEESPRYHARDVAVVRGRMAGAVVVLGSATPCLESYHNARRGKYRLLELRTRADNARMPLVRVVDMRHAVKADRGAPIFSPQLKEAMTQRLERHEQTILFLNRRGYSTSLVCPQCGYVAQCPNCSLALTFHRSAGRLRCHICNHDAPAPKVCPEESCKHPGIRYAGLGTQKVEETLRKLFPQAQISRMDSDTLQKKDDYRRLLGDFRTGKTDILVGTQMIAKGLHFPNVTLVGIVHADLSLHVPDFRAGERTFQLLTQVAGRAGRGDVEGEVFVQSFTPFHPAIRCAPRRADYAGFYEAELEFRESLRYPPFARVALLTLKGRNEQKVELAAQHVADALRPLLARAVAPAGGPAAARIPPRPRTCCPAWRTPAADRPRHRRNPKPPPWNRSRTSFWPARPPPRWRRPRRFRYQIMLRTRLMSRLARHLARLQDSVTLPEDVTMAIDIDPMNLM